MYLSKVEIANFRNLRDCTIELQQGLNVLVGRNNVGKTNVLQAIRHALGPSAARGELAPLDRDDFWTSQDSTDDFPAIRITLTFSGLTEADRTHFFEIVVPDLKIPSNSIARICFEATWTARNRVSTRRWGGPENTDRAQVPNELLEALPVTFLPALRDAEAALTPGYRSRLAHLFRDLAAKDKGHEEGILEVFIQANKDLEAQQLITTTRDTLRERVRRMSGTDYRVPSIGAAEPDFYRILRTLRVTLDEEPISELAASGLGYQNVLYIATILAHLKTVAEQDCPLLLVEEPEAHLHPQLVVLLGGSFSKQEPGKDVPQTIVTTHSPTLAAHVRPSQLVVMTAGDARAGKCRSLAKAGLSDPEERALLRMMDITRSALYFAKGAVLVEGISEALLLPALALHLGLDLKAAHISVIPICGVAFATFAKLLKPEVLGIPIVILTDGDPGVQYPDPEKKDWRVATPKKDGDKIALSPRTRQLLNDFKNHENVEVFYSSVTLEYDLAMAGENNAKLMAEAWESTFKNPPRTLNSTMIAQAKTIEERGLVVWRGICVAENSGSKADFAHQLTAAFDNANNGSKMRDFVVPKYITDALNGLFAALHQGPHDASSNSD